jgi:hypothetical protein
MARAAVVVVVAQAPRTQQTQAAQAVQVRPAALAAPLLFMERAAVVVGTQAVLLAVAAAVLVVGLT